MPLAVARPFVEEFITSSMKAQVKQLAIFINKKY